MCKDGPTRFDRLYRWLTCWRHEFVTSFDGSRIFLRCTKCGHTTPGWDVEKGMAA